MRRRAMGRGLTMKKKTLRGEFTMSERALGWELTMRKERWGES